MCDLNTPNTFDAIIERLDRIEAIVNSIVSMNKISSNASHKDISSERSVMNFRDTASLLGIKQQALMYFLEDKGWIYRVDIWYPTPLAKNNGWLEFFNPPRQTVVTSLGLEEIKRIIR
jgi:hypothetical protein